MALMSIRANQIKDHQISDNHINGKLTEAVLEIDFLSHASEILDTKLLVDYIQKSDITVVAPAETMDIVLASPNAALATDKGIVLDAKVKIRDNATGEPVIDGSFEVFGKLTAYVDNAGQHTYTLSFFSGPAGSETPYTAAAGKIDILYPQRYSLSDIPANFLENERFVDGAADITAHLNLEQIAKDIFGAGYDYANIGTFTNPFGNTNTLVQELVKQTSGVVNTSERAPAIIDEIVNSRGNKVSLDARLDVSLNDDGTLKLGSRIHAHVLKETEMLADATAVDFAFGASDILDTPKASDTFVVYVNGIRHLGKGANKQYLVSIAGATVTINFVSTVYADDLVELEAIIHGVE